MPRKKPEAPKTDLKAERAKMLEPRQTYRYNFDRADFSGYRPMNRPKLDTKRDIPQTTYRPGSLDAFNLPSRGFA